MAEVRLPIIADLDIDGSKIENVGAPTEDTDAANKEYVDEGLAEQVGIPEDSEVPTSSVLVFRDVEGTVIEDQVPISDFGHSVSFRGFSGVTLVPTVITNQAVGTDHENLALVIPNTSDSRLTAGRGFRMERTVAGTDYIYEGTISHRHPGSSGHDVLDIFPPMTQTQTSVFVAAQTANITYSVANNGPISFIEAGSGISMMDVNGVLTITRTGSSGSGPDGTEHTYYQLLTEDDPRTDDSYDLDTTSATTMAAHGIPNSELHAAGSLRDGGTISIARPSGSTGPFYLILNIDTTALPIGDSSFTANGFIAGFERFGANDDALGDYETFVTRLDNDLTVFRVTEG